MSERNKAKIELIKMIKENEGWIYIGLVHHFYGPLRSLNFLIKAENAGIEETLDFIEELSERENPKSFSRSFIEKFHSMTGLVVNVAIFPLEMKKSAQVPPSEIKNLKELLTKSLSIADNHKDDMFYFRTDKF